MASTADQIAPPKDTRSYVTSLAFVIDPDLLGQPLAGPIKRLIAIALDFLLIGIIAGRGGDTLLIIGGLMCLYGSYFLYFKRSKKARAIALGLFGFILVAAGVTTIPISVSNPPTSSNHSYEEDIDERIDNIELGLVDTVLYLSLFVEVVGKVEQLECKADYIACLEPNLQIINQSLLEKGVDEDVRYKIFKESLSDLAIPDDDKEALLGKFVELQSEDQSDNSQLVNKPTSSQSNPADTEAATPPPKTLVTENTGQNQQIETIVEDALKTVPSKQQTPSSTESGFSLIQWAKGLASDLGLSFGFAAIYFSTFLSYWKGQTPGKRIMGIRVIRLDGRRMNLWDAFGRYGGYSAGLATGLLGFLQIYWDANRMTIQDKISETVVLDLRKQRAEEHAR